MLIVCVGLVFCSKSMQFHIICSFYNSMSINTSEVDPHSDSLHNGIVKPKNIRFWNSTCTSTKASVVTAVLPLTRSAQDITLLSGFAPVSNSRLLTAFFVFSAVKTGGGLGAGFLPGESLRTAQASDCGLKKQQHY